MSRTNPTQKKRTGLKPQTGLTRRLPLLAAAALTTGCLLPATPPVQAAGYVYQQHTLNAGVLVNGTGPVFDPAPYLFYVLNSRPDVRPADLNLINPLAPAGVAPNASAYWEVLLNNVTDSQLAQYNVLYLPANGVKIPPAVNEKLRRYVDNGGQLIVEYEAANTAPATVVTTGLFTGTAATGSTGGTLGFPSASGAELHQPVVAQPYFLTASDLAGLAVPAAAVPLYLSANTSDSIHSSEFGSLFSPALVAASGPVISTAQLGAGQIVASTLNIGLGISVGNAAVYNPANLYTASAADLKLLANILTWSEAHPNENKTSHGNASLSGLASYSPAWQYPLTSSTGSSSAPAGAAVWGNFVFVNDAAGTLHAFNAYPSQPLTGGGTDTYPGTSYDEVWNRGIGVNSSAPTVASVKGVNSVFVEKSDGSVAAYNAVTGAAVSLPATPTSTLYTAVSYPQSGTVNAPSPTFYEGRLYAGQANGTLSVYDLNENTSAVVPLSGSTTSGEYVTAAPAVGTVANGDTTTLTATVPTSLNVYTVLLGARNEALVPYLSGTTSVGYKINRYPEYNLNSIFADVNSVAPPLQAYDYNGVALAATVGTSAAPPQDPLFTTGTQVGFYTDWNMDFAAATGAAAASTTLTPLNLLLVSTNSYGALTASTAVANGAAVSAPAIDRHGDYYFTETNGSNSYLIGISNSAQRGSIHIKFRFRLPTTGDGALTSPYTPWNYVDGDGVNYTSLIGYHFAGAPVVDDQGNVYAAAVGSVTGGGATSTSTATVLCFRGSQQVSTATSATDLTSDTFAQPDEQIAGTEDTIVPGPDVNPGGINPVYGQFLNSGTSLSFYNFGYHVPGQPQQLAGDFSEPQPIYAKTESPSSYTPLPLRTNLAWYVPPFTVAGNVSGLTQVGSNVFLTDGTGLYRFTTTPQTTLKVATSAPTATSLGTTGTNGTAPGTVGAPPSVGGSVMVIAGAHAIAARTRQVTVIADNNRVLGVDGDGAAVWAVDATTRTDQTTSVATKVPFSHPTALSQFAQNDYLVADTGSNRCVRFDTGGNVQWELTRFTDAYGLMASGQPMTLSQPTSVVTRPNTVILPATDPLYPGGTATFYLVADSGNDRIVEVADIVDSGGTLHNHILTWVSHTADTNGRHYRYGSAVYYPNAVAPSGLSVAATVTNTRIGPLAATGGPGPISGDGPGGSIAVFNYPASPIGYSPTAPSDLIYTAAGFYTQNSSGTYTPLTVRNPRFLQLYTPPLGATPTTPTGLPAFDFLYADDNGAFDLTYDTTRKAFVAGADRLQFTAASYASMVTPTDAPTTAVPTGSYVRTGLPFVPTCVQGLSTDTQGSGVSTTTTRRYLITQNYSQGELGTPSATGKIGGEVFEIDVISSPSSGASSQTAVGGFGGNLTLSHPDLTSPLTQPTFAVRLP